MPSDSIILDLLITLCFILLIFASELRSECFLSLELIRPLSSILFICRCCRMSVRGLIAEQLFEQEAATIESYEG